jgi:general secretion pathway protein G
MGEQLMLERLNALRDERKSQKGFTLIELLIVIVILGVLAGIVVFAVGAFNNDGQLAACKADKKNVEIAIEAYYAQTGSRPASGVYTQLTATPAQYLKEAPNSPHYAFTWDANGNVTAVAGSTDGPPSGC